MYATTYLEQKVLDTLRGITANAPSTTYVGLFLSSPGDTGNEGVEVSYSGYARRPIAFTVPSTVGGFRTIRNNAEITFATSPSDVGTIRFLGVFDAATGGNCLLYGEFTEAPTIEANEAPVLVTNEVSWWITGNVGTVFADRALNFIRGTSITGFTPHVALFNGNANEGGTELSGNAYARAPVAFGASTKVGTGSRIANSSAASTARSTGPWGIWDHTNIMDALVGGSTIALLPRQVPKTTKTGIKVIFEIGQLAITLN